jgi:hypothetical protein
MSDVQAAAVEPSANEGVFGEGFAAMFSGSPHGGDTPKPAEALPVEVPGQTDAKAADAGKAASEVKADEAKPDDADKKPAPPGVIAERRRAQAAERQNAELAQTVTRQGQILEQLLSRLQPQPEQFYPVADPTDLGRFRDQVRREAAAHGQAAAQEILEKAEAQHAARTVHHVANNSMAAAAQEHGEDVVEAALGWAKSTGRAGPQSPYLGSADPYGELVNDFRGELVRQETARAKLLGRAPPAPVSAPAAAASKTAASQVRIPPTLASATPAGAAAARTVQDDDSFFAGMFRPG